MSLRQAHRERLQPAGRGRRITGEDWVMFQTSASRGDRLALVFAALTLFFVGHVRAVSPSPRPGDSLPPPSPGYVYSPGEIDAARAELALVEQDLERMLENIQDHAARQLGSGSSSLMSQIDVIAAEGKLEIRAAWQTFDTVPEQQLPLIVYQNQGFSRRLATSKRIMLGAEPWVQLPGSFADPRSAALMSADDPHTRGAGDMIDLSSGSAERSLAARCPNDAVFTCGADEVSNDICFLRDVGECVDLCESLTSFLSISKNSTPVDIHVVAAGFGVNLPSPIKIGIEIVHSIAKLACNILECALDNSPIGECTGTETLDLLKTEKRFTDDEELAAQTAELKSKIDSGNTNLVADISNVIATELNREERFTSDQELTQMEGTLLNEISALRELSCNLEKMMFTQMGKRYRPSAACALPSASPSSYRPGAPRAIGGAMPAGGPVVVSGRMPSSADGSAPGSVTGPLLETLWIEAALLDGRSIPSLYLPSEKGGSIEQVRELVWRAIDAQEDLGIAPSQTPGARILATQADSLLDKQEFVAAYKTYSRAYRSLLEP